MFKRTGFTLIEIVVVVAVVLVLFSFVSVNLFSLPSSSTADSTVNTLLGNIKTQQVKAMVGDTEGRGQPDAYGIYFTSNSYTQFHGSTFNISDPDNFVNLLPTDYSIETSFPSATIVFNKSSGEISGFSSTQNTIIVKDNTTGNQKVIIFNKYGTIITVD